MQQDLKVESLEFSRGCKTWILQNEDGQINQTHSVSAGLDYAAIGPEHAYYRDLNRIKYAFASDSEAMLAFQTLSSTEGIIPALETSHGLAYAIKKRAKELPKGKNNLCKFEWKR